MNNLNLKLIYEEINLQQHGIIELKDNLTTEILREKHMWILIAKIENAIIGLTKDKKNIKWYNGVWKYGTWKYGEWMNGIWEKGVWENGIWHKGIWYNGIWKLGSWLGGKWIKGIKWKNK